MRWLPVSDVSLQLTQRRNVMNTVNLFYRRDEDLAAKICRALKVTRGAWTKKAAASPVAESSGHDLSNQVP